MGFLRKRAFEAVAIPILLFMAVWVIVFPASYWVGWRPGYEGRMRKFVVRKPVPRDVLVKYVTTPDVKLTHIIPAGIWSLCGVLQLVPWIRQTRPRLHRMSGRVLLVCSALIAVGYILIETHGIAELLRATGAAPSGAGSGSSDVSPVPLRRPAGPWLLKTMIAWFIFTGGVAFQLARQRRIIPHSRWARRHMAAGGWVIVQRVLLVMLDVAATVAGMAWSDAQRLQVFDAMAIVAIALTLAGTELVLLLEGARVMVTKGGPHGATREGVPKVVAVDVVSIGKKD